MTDQREIDQLLVAFFVEGTDEIADRVIDAALDEIDHTEQRRASRALRRSPTMHISTRVAAAAVIGVLAVGGMLILVRPGQPAVGTPTPGPSSSSVPTAAVVVSPAPSPTPSPPAATPSPTAAPCLTDTLEVLTGDALQAAAGDATGEAMAGLGSGRGVFVRQLGYGTAGLWAAGPGDAPSRPIAMIQHRPIVFDVVDLSPNGSEALIRAGTLSINSPEPECVDLYVVPTDGSSATRLTPARGGRAVSGAAFSPDGRRVAYSWWDGSGTNTITVLDIGSRRTVDQPCRLNFGFPPGRIDWSPNGDRIAILCYDTLTVFDASGTTDPVGFPPTDDVLTFGWTSDGELLVATGGNEIRSFDAESGTSTQIGRFDDAAIELVTPSSGGFSPDGQWLVFLGGERGDTPGNDSRIVGYLVPTAGGTPTRILNENEAGQSIDWSTDGRTLIAAHETARIVDGGPDVVLGRLDPETLDWSEIGALPGGQGVWQIP